MVSSSGGQTGVVPGCTACAGPVLASFKASAVENRTEWRRLEWGWSGTGAEGLTGQP